MDSSKKQSLFDYFQEEINNEQLQFEVLNDEKCFNKSFELEETNTVINKDTNFDEDYCYDMLKAFDDAFETIYGDNTFNFIQVQQISEELQNNCIRLINMVKKKEECVDLKLLESKNVMTENESLTTINQLNCQIAELNLQLKEQSILSFNIGSTLGYFLWRATRIPLIINMILQQDKITNFAKLMISVLKSFNEKYNNEIPPIKTYETKFVISMLGIVANLTTTKDGCRFFSQANDGINVVQHIIFLVSYSYLESEMYLKKVAYATLYNVSIKFNGHLLMENDRLIKRLQDDIKEISNENINEALLFALKLLHSLTLHINESMYNILKSQIDLQEILRLTRFSETELIARKIFENISIANEKFKDEFELL